MVKFEISLSSRNEAVDTVEKAVAEVQRKLIHIMSTLSQEMLSDRIERTMSDENGQRLGYWAFKWEDEDDDD